VITPAPVSSSAAGAPPRKAAHGSVPAGREADVITRAFGTSVVAAQVVGLIILALAVAYTVIQLSARRRLRPQLSGQAMAAATPIDAERGRGQLGDLANGLPRRKAEEPQMACDGRLTASHGQTHRPQLEANDHVTAKFAELDALIAAAAASFEAIITQLRTADRSGDQLTSTALAEVHAGIAAAATSRPSGSADTTQRA
jgi:hypothetical protein